MILQQEEHYFRGWGETSAELKRLELDESEKMVVPQNSTRKTPCTRERAASRPKTQIIHLRSTTFDLRWTRAN